MSLLVVFCGAIVLSSCEGAVLGEGSRTGVAVEVYPSSPHIKPLASIGLYATVTGAASSSVTWSISGGSGCGSITQSGVYTAPQSLGVCQVIATSQVDDSASDIATVTTSETGGDNLFNGGIFILGVQGPNTWDFDLWAARGMNAIVGAAEPGNGRNGTMGQYVQAIRDYNTSAGRTVFHMMHSPLNGEVSGGDVWAWEQTVSSAPTDEPNAGPGRQRFKDSLPELQANYVAWKARDRNMPVWLNFSGADYIRQAFSVTNDWNYRALYEESMNYGDWITFDIYPFADYNDWCTVNGVSTANQASVIGYGLDMLRTQTTKPVMAYIQVGITSTGDRSVYPIDVRNQMWNAIIHGARGIMIWIANANDGYNDSTPAENGNEIAANASWINSVSDVLTDQIIEPVTLGPQDSIKIGTIHVGGRKTAAGNYYFVQNISKTASWTGTIPLAESGTATDATIYTMPSGWPNTTTAVTSTCTNCISNGSMASQTLAPGAVVIYEVQQ